MTKSELSAIVALAKSQGTQIGLANVGDVFSALVGLVYAIAPEYSKTATYAKDDLVIYEGKVYAAKSAIGTAEEWTAAHWQETTLAAAIAKKADKV